MTRSVYKVSSELQPGDVVVYYGARVRVWGPICRDIDGCLGREYWQRNRHSPVVVTVGEVIAGAEHLYPIICRGEYVQVQGNDLMRWTVYVDA